MDKYVCCICGKESTGWGNNPWPVDTRDNVKCCDECNDTKVIQARLFSMMLNMNKSRV